MAPHLINFSYFTQSEYINSIEQKIMSNISVINMNNKSAQQITEDIHKMITVSNDHRIKKVFDSRRSFKDKLKHRFYAISYDPSVPFVRCPGEHISNAITFTIALANHFNTVMSLSFNGNLIPVKPNSTSEEVYANWDKICQDAIEAWENSDEGIAYRKQAKQDEIYNINSAEQLMTQFNSVNWYDLNNVLSFLNQSVDVLGIDVINLGIGNKINQKLIEAGYYKNANCGDQFDGENKENFGKYLIGQAMDCLSEVGSIHQIYGLFYKEFLEKFTI